MTARQLITLNLLVACLGCGGPAESTASMPASPASMPEADSDLPADVVRRCESLAEPIILQSVVDDHQHVTYSHSFAVRIDPDAEPDGATHVLIGLARFSGDDRRSTLSMPFAVYVIDNQPVRAQLMLPPMPTRVFHPQNHDPE